MSGKTKRRLAVLVALAFVMPASAMATDGFVGPARGPFPQREFVWAPVLVPEPGFPVQTYHAGGGYGAGPGVNTVVGNMDSDPELEIVVSGLGSGQIHAWNHDGSPLAGWPVSFRGAGYPTMGALSASNPGLEVFTAHFASPGDLAALAVNGSPLPGWPRGAANYVRDPASVVDLEGDGLAEIFICEQNHRVTAYRADGSLVPNWPYEWLVGTQSCGTPAVADVDGDGSLDVITATMVSIPSGASVIALRADATPLPGFPVVAPTGFALTPLAVGDVDGDGRLEIVMVRPGGGGSRPDIYVYSGTGTVEGVIPLTGEIIYYGSAPALADLDGDGVPEIVVQTNATLYVLKADGTPFPGWPRSWGLYYEYFIGNSGPVVGDVTGDGNPDILVASEIASGFNASRVMLFDAHGNLDPRFPMILPLGSGAVPAIADFDLDGRNELILTGAFWNGIPGYYDKVWAFDLGGGPHGQVHWGQFMAEPTHRGVYPLGLTGVGLQVDDTGSGNGNAMLEPGEGAIVATHWRNMGTFTRTLTGTATGFTGPDPNPRRYVLEDATADHGEVREGASTDCVDGGDCYGIAVGPRRPLPHWDATLSETLGEGPRKAWTVHIGGSFTDVAQSNPFYKYVETLLHRGVTTGCADESYCPLAAVTRADMAVFTLRAKEGSVYTPPACGTPLFGDVPASSPYCRWVEELARRGVVSGCGGGNYCPSGPVTREQMAVFVLRTLDPALDPPACTNPPFGDLLRTSPYCRWIAELHRRGIVTGCGNGYFCPHLPVSREQMSVFLALTFGLTLYGL